MKKAPLCFLAIALLLPGYVLRAQESLPIALGFRAGLNLGDNSANFTPVSKSLRTAPLFGAYSEFGIAQALFLTGEFTYLPGGTNLSYGNFNGTFKVDEFIIPVSLKYKILGNAKVVKPYFFTGLNVGFVTNSELETVGGTFSFKDSTETVDWGWHIGGGIEIPTSDLVAVTLDARYSLGLVNLDKSGADSKSRNLSFIVGVNFRAN